MQRTQVPSLGREDPTCHGATSPVHYNDWAHVLPLLKPQRRCSATRSLPTTMNSPHSQLEKAHAQQQISSIAKKQIICFKSKTFSSSSRAVHNILSHPLSRFADTETHTRWKVLIICCPQVCRPQTGWNQKADDVDFWLPHHQPIRRMSKSWLHTLQPPFCSYL